MLGAERTTFWPTIQDLAQRSNLVTQPDQRPEQGSYYRSDHFSFARAGIPAFSIEMGQEFVGKPAGFGEKAFEEFNAEALPPAFGRIPRRLGPLRYGADSRVSDFYSARPPRTWRGFQAGTPAKNFSQRARRAE